MIEASTDWMPVAATAEERLLPVGIKTPPRLDSLTGLRFVAALAVFFYHTAGLFPIGVAKNVFDIVAAPGLVGVSFFFILSGFVLSWSHRADDAPRAFYRRRFARIAPAYWVAFLYGAAFALAVGHRHIAGVVLNLFPAVVGLQAWVPNAAVNYAGNGALWSLSAEAFFYLLFPVLIIGLRERRYRIAVVAIAVAAIVFVPVVLHPEIRTSVSYWAIYVFPVQRFAEFCCGAALGTVMRNGWKFPVPFFIAVPLAVVAYLVDGFAPTWAQSSLVTFVPFVLLIGSAAQQDLDGRASFARDRRLVRLGEWSYAFYLVHQVTGFVVFEVVKRVLPGDGGAIVTLVVSLGLSIVGAACLYYLVERPLEKRLRRARPRMELLTP